MEPKIILIDKPKGWTSFDVVAKIRGFEQQKRKLLHESRGVCDPNAKPDVEHNCKCKRIKVGHTGTLDPLATGLLVLAIGKATKDIPKLIKLDKTYEVEATLGIVSTTGDGEGELTKADSDVQEAVHKLEVEAIEDATKEFVGDIMQTPPSYSAIKVDGVRAYELARRGKTVKLEPRPVTIHSIKDVTYTAPVASFTADVGSGTYIRTLVEDIGTKLGTGAYMSALRRTRVGDYKLEDAVTVEEYCNSCHIPPPLV